MNSFRKLVLNGLLGQIGSVPDYRIRLNAVGWLDKGVLTLQDIQQLDAAMKARSGAAGENGAQGGGAV